MEVCCAAKSTGDAEPCGSHGLQGQWPALKGQVKQQWGKLTDVDLWRLSGKMEELADVLRRRYGYGKAQAEIEINQWVYAHDTTGKGEL